MSIKWKKSLLIACLVIFLSLVIFVFFREMRDSNRSKVLLNTTGYEDRKYNQLWPASSITKDGNGYMVRMALEPELNFGYVEFNNMVVRAWNYAIYKDSSGKIQKVAIPRVWARPETNDIYFMFTTAPSRIEGYSDKFVINRSKNIDSILTDRQPLVGVYFAPNDPDIGIDFRNFYQPLSAIKLPESFIRSGDTSDLPKLSGIGVFFPATQVMFDIVK